MIRNILWRILSILTAVVLFVFIVWLFPKKNSQTDISNMELTYIFVDEYGNEYNIFSQQWHGSATDWSFLFEDDWSDSTTNEQKTDITTEKTTIYTWNSEKKDDLSKSHLNTWNDITKTTWDTDTTQNTWEDKISPNSTWERIAGIKLIQEKLPETLREKAYKLQIPYTLLQEDPELVSLILGSQVIQSDENKQSRLWWISSMADDQVENLRSTLIREKEKQALLEKKYGNSWNDISGQEWNTLWDKDYVWDNNSDSKHSYKSCVTPWNMVVQHGEYVLAYQQRSDVPDVCNVQKRVCRDGVLNGTYTQWYCNEDVPYQYTKVKVTEYNKKDESQVVQTPKYTKYDGASYDKYGKRNWSGNTPTTIRDDGYKTWAIKTTNTTTLNHKTFMNCVSPWWDIVVHGQFVKAYASPLWFTDDGCKVELRLCMDGELQWTYAYSKCKYTNISYSDYIDGDKTIYDLYNEAYNLSDTTTSDPDLANLYQDLDDIYGSASWVSHNMSDDTDVTDSDTSDSDDTDTQKSWIRQVRERLFNLF